MTHLNRIYEPAAYGPQGACFWADTVPAHDWPSLPADLTADVAIIGGGFTGLSAALHLAQAGIAPVVLEAQRSGWGASGRNGGFCCLGGAKASDAQLAARFGRDAPLLWHQTERRAVETVDALITDFGMQVDRHSQGETQLAHTAKAWDQMRQQAESVARAYNVTPQLIESADLPAHEMGGAWHGAMTIPLGFALNPRKYHSGLAKAALGAGAKLFAQSPVQKIDRLNKGWVLATPRGRVTARKVILATNGYSSENLPDWLRGRYLPVQSSVIVTRPLSKEEQAAQGWTTAQMAYDSRKLLHYFRLMPDGRFLFGMRGGLRATPAAQAAIARRIRSDFAAMFPAWRNIEITHEWSGLVCLTASLTPFVGAVPDHPGLYAGLGFHGNGVAMGTEAGRILSALVMGQDPEVPAMPGILAQPPRRFPLGRHRRALLAPAYWMAETFDL